MQRNTNMSDEVKTTPAEPPVVAQPAAGPADPNVIRDDVVKVLKTCFDPEIPVNIHELGLIYDIAVSDEPGVDVKMTLTSPACPVAGTLPPEVQRKIEAIPGVVRAKVEVVWDPPWDPSRMSEAARLQLNMF